MGQGVDKGFLLDVEMGRGGGAQINSCVNISVGIRGGWGGGEYASSYPSYLEPNHFT